MPLSAKSLHASGSISDKQMAKLQVLRGTRAQKSKMAPFEQKTKDEGHQSHVGARGYSVNEINDKSQQKKGKYGRVSKGGSVNHGGQPGVNAINQSDYVNPKFPAGSKVKSSNPKTGNTRMKAKTKQRSLPMYGNFGGRPA